MTSHNNLYRRVTFCTLYVNKIYPHGFVDTPEDCFFFCFVFVVFFTHSCSACFIFTLFLFMFFLMWFIVFFFTQFIYLFLCFQIFSCLIFFSYVIFFHMIHRIVYLCIGHLWFIFTWIVFTWLAYFHVTFPPWFKLHRILIWVINFTVY